MEWHGRESLMGGELEKEVDKRGMKPWFQGGSTVWSLKNLHLGKAASQGQHKSIATNLLGGHFVSKDLDIGSEPFRASILEASQTYSSKERNLAFHDRSLDVDSSNGLRKLLKFHKIISGEVTELEENALEILISCRINQGGRGSTPWTLILSTESADVPGLACNQSLEKVKLTKHIIILQVPLANAYTFTEEVSKEIAEKFQLHYHEGIQVVYPLGKRFFVTTINCEKPINLVRSELLGEGELQQQLKIAEFVGGHFKSREDLVNASDEGWVLSSSCQSDKQLTQVGLDWSDKERASVSKSGGAQKHIQAGDDCSGQGKASASSSESAKELSQVGKKLRCSVQKEGVPKKWKKY